MQEGTEWKGVPGLLAKGYGQGAGARGSLEGRACISRAGDNKNFRAGEGGKQG